MTSADFSDYGFPCSETSPVRAFSFLQSLRHLHICPQITILGVTRVWLLTQNKYASYAVPVRQYRILQSRFLHCCRHQQPACDLLILRATNPRIRDFHPLEKIHLLKALFNQKYLYFCNFSLALQQVRTAHAGRTSSGLPCRRLTDRESPSHHCTYGSRIQRFVKKWRNFLIINE